MARRDAAAVRRFQYWRWRYWLRFVATAPLWLPQALAIRRRALRFPAAAGPTWGVLDRLGHWQEDGLSGEQPKLQVFGLGDSIIAGVGVEQSRESLSAMLAAALARRMQYSAQWCAWGESGLDTRAASERLWPQLNAYLQANNQGVMRDGGAGLVRQQGAGPIQIVVISLGANDITALRSSGAWRRDLLNLHQRLRHSLPEAWIIWLAQPPFGVFPLLPGSLRRLLSDRAQAFDALADSCLTQDARSLLLGHGPEPSGLDFAEDGFHPNAQAVARWAQKLATELDAIVRPAAPGSGH